MEPLRPYNEGDFKVDNNPFAFSPGQLNKLLNPKSLAAFRALGGLQGIARGLHYSPPLTELSSTAMNSGHLIPCVEDKAQSRTEPPQRTPPQLGRCLPMSFVEPFRTPSYEPDDYSASEHPSTRQIFKTMSTQSNPVGSICHDATESLSELLLHQIIAIMGQMLLFVQLHLLQDNSWLLGNVFRFSAGQHLDPVQSFPSVQHHWPVFEQFHGFWSRSGQRTRNIKVYSQRLSANAATDGSSLCDGTWRPILPRRSREFDNKRYITGLSLTACHKSVRAGDHGGQQNVAFFTQNYDIFARRSTLGNPKVSKLWLSLLACFALSNFVTVAQPSDTVYWGTVVSGTLSTLCSVLELRLPTGIEADRIDLQLVVMNMSLSGLSLLMSIIFVWLVLLGWLEGREKNIYALLVAFFTPPFCYISSRSLIQEGHHWLEGIPLFVNMCALLVACGITGLRNMRLGRR